MWFLSFVLVRLTLTDAGAYFDKNPSEGAHSWPEHVKNNWMSTLLITLDGAIRYILETFWVDMKSVWLDLYVLSYDVDRKEESHLQKSCLSVV
jgi:hypothetical protein